MAVATLVPIEEYLSTSRDPDREYAGELDHSCLQGMIYSALQRRGLHTFVELRVRVQASRFRIPDVSAVRGARPPGRFLRQPAHIVVEILSSEDRAGDIDDRVEDYLEFGVGNILVVDPRCLRVAIRTSEGSRICRETVETPDGAISIPLAGIFADMPSIAEEQ